MRGYPPQRGFRVARAPAVRAVAATFAVGAPARSLTGALGGIKIPGPPPGSVAGAALAVGAAALYYYGPALIGGLFGPLAPPRAPARRVVNPNFVLIETRRGNGFGTIRPETIKTGYLAHARSSTYPPVGTSVAFFRPTAATNDHPDANLPFWMFQDPMSPVTVLNNWYLGVSTEIKQGPGITAGWNSFANEMKLYRNLTGSSQNASSSRPGAYGFPGIAPGSKRSNGGVSPSSGRGRGITAVPPGRAASPSRGRSPALTVPDVPPVDIAPPRGIGVSVTRGNATWTPAMGSGPEVKMQVSAAVAGIINATLGQFGEAVDLTRCVLYATGNTYFDARGREMVIPRSEWFAAIAMMAGVGRSVRTDRGNVRNRFAVHDARGFVTQDRRRITHAQAGYRLTQCVVTNWLQDMEQGLRSGLQARMQADMGLVAGPLTATTVIDWLQSGNPAYSGSLDLYL